MERWQSPAECTCLENRRTERYRGFESHPLRHNKKCQGKKLGTFFILGLDNFFVSRYSENIDWKEFVMEVFALLGGWEYEGSALLGVYASEEEARSAHGVYTRDGDRFIDFYFIERRVVGAGAEADFLSDRRYI